MRHVETRSLILRIEHAMTNAIVRALADVVRMSHGQFSPLGPELFSGTYHLEAVDTIAGWELTDVDVSFRVGRDAVNVSGKLTTVVAAVPDRANGLQRVTPQNPDFPVLTVGDVYESLAGIRRERHVIDRPRAVHA